MLPQLALVILSIGCITQDVLARQLLIRDRLWREEIHAAPGRCMNTMQGQWLLADDKGYLCTRDEMDYSTGCCKTGTQYSCDLCKSQDKCCSEYESCVSCCLHPKHEADKLYSVTYKSPKLKSAGTWETAWEFCRGICRTHGFSTQHENAYISSRHHCFSTLGKPMISDPLPAGALNGVTLAMSDKGQSCDDACEAKGLSCSASHLPVINSCDRLREIVACEAGCEAWQLSGGSAPCYMDTTAPKASRPAMCFVAPASDVPNLKCSSKDNHASRLCPCRSQTTP